MTTKEYNEIMKSRGLTPVPNAKPPRGDGYRSSHERKYAAVLMTEQSIGKIDWYAYEPFRIRLADRTTYCPDFAIIEKGVLRFIEVKGWSKSLATGLAKVKIAAEHFPWRFTIARWKEGAWEYQELPGLIDRISVSILPAVQQQAEFGIETWRHVL